jgi:hypothetical protein
MFPRESPAAGLCTPAEKAARLLVKVVWQIASEVALQKYHGPDDALINRSLTARQVLG